MADIDQRFYPATDMCDWEPLRLALEPCPIDGWMFMCATVDGWRFYKHATTREPLALHAVGNEVA
jgi:hypothetical protein